MQGAGLHIPKADFSECLAAPSSPPPAPSMSLPYDLPNPSVRTILLGILDNLVSLLGAGHDLELPHHVITIMKANWSIHIPILALTTHSLASTSLTAKEEAGQAVVQKTKGPCPHRTGFMCSKD
ncbi:hypothetical protein BS17DRAFT_821765 [Gyrodon lividus]|nr:hypothetical protein BS17DRAFT_821765 [Gyrodon lividus]